MSAHLHVIDNAHPLIAGAVLAHVLPWDHITNAAWAIGTSFASWLLIRVVVYAWKRWGPKI